MKFAPIGRVLKQTGQEFVSDNCMGNGAAIAYYTIFSLPSLLAIVFAVSTQFWPEETVTRVISSQLGLPIENAELAADSDEGGQNADNDTNITAVAKRAADQKQKGHAWWAKILGVAILVFSASGVLASVQMALNKAWNVEPDPSKSGLKMFLLKRALSLGMLVVIGFLLMVSLVVTTLVDEFTRWFHEGEATKIMLAFSIVVNNLLAWGFASVLFASAFKILPDAEIEWRDVWNGAIVTGLLFVVGKSVIAWYLQFSHAGSSWGSAAASMVGVLVWVYYSSLITLAGAEFTQNWAIEFGGGLEPAHGAVLVSEQKKFHTSEKELLESREQ